MKQIKQNNKGFTLIELVVVIAIIGILGAAVFLTIKPQEILANSRNAVRKSDMRTISQAISKAVANNEVVLVETSGLNSNSVSKSIAADGSTGSYVNFNTQPTATPGFKLDVNKLPLDPSNGSTIVPPTGVTLNGDKIFKYVYCSDGIDWEINAYLENDSTKKDMANDGGDNNNAYEVGSKLTICPANPF